MAIKVLDKISSAIFLLVQNERNSHSALQIIARYEPDTKQFF